MFNQNVTKILLDDIFNRAQRKLQEKIQEFRANLPHIRKRAIQNVTAMLSKSNLLNDNERSRLQMHYQFN